MSAIQSGSHAALSDNNELDDAVMLASLDGPDEARAQATVRILSALAALSPDSVLPLVDALVARVFSPGPVARRAALADAMAALGAPATAELLWRLDADDAEHRFLAARALASPRHSRASAALCDRLHDDTEHEDVRAACARALAGQGDSTAADPLAAGASSNSAVLRRACADALGKLPKNKKAGVTLARLGADDDADVRVSALTALLCVGGAHARRTAVHALSCADGPSRAAALLVLARHGAASDVAHAHAHADAADARVRRAARACLDALAC